MQVLVAGAAPAYGGARLAAPPPPARISRNWWAAIAWSASACQQLPDDELPEGGIDDDADVGAAASAAEADQVAVRRKAHASVLDLMFCHHSRQEYTMFYNYVGHFAGQPLPGAWYSLYSRYSPNPKYCQNCADPYNARRW